jgi:hypothetical protein
MKSSKQSNTKTEDEEDFEALELSRLPQSQDQFTDEGFKSKTKEINNGKPIRN